MKDWPRHRPDCLVIGAILGNRRVMLQAMCWTHLSQDKCNRPIRLGQLSFAFRKTAGVFWVHFDQRQVVGQRCFERAVIRACGFVNHAGGLVWPDPAAQLLETGLGVGELLENPVTQPVTIEFVFGNVYANAIVCHLRHVLCLSSETAISAIPSRDVAVQCTAGQWITL